MRTECTVKLHAKNTISLFIILENKVPLNHWYRNYIDNAILNDFWTIQKWGILQPKVSEMSPIALLRNRFAMHGMHGRRSRVKTLLLLLRNLFRSLPPQRSLSNEDYFGFPAICLQFTDVVLFLTPQTYRVGQHWNRPFRPAMTLPCHTNLIYTHSVPWRLKNLSDLSFGYLPPSPLQTAQSRFQQTCGQRFAQSSSIPPNSHPKHMLSCLRNLHIGEIIFTIYDIYIHFFSISITSPHSPPLHENQTQTLYLSLHSGSPVQPTSS